MRRMKSEVVFYHLLWSSESQKVLFLLPSVVFVHSEVGSVLQLRGLRCKKTQR